MSTTTARFFFDSLGAAATGLITVLEDARETDSKYQFGSLNAAQILVSGLHLRGDIEAVATKLEDVPGAIRYDD